MQGECSMSLRGGSRLESATMPKHKKNDSVTKNDSTVFVEMIFVGRFSPTGCAHGGVKVHWVDNVGAAWSDKMQLSLAAMLLCEI